MKGLIRRKSLNKKNGNNLFNLIKINLSLILLVIFFLLFFNVFKPLFYTISFSILSFIVSWVSSKIKLPVGFDFTVMGIIVLSYMNQFNYIYLIMLLWFIGKLILGKFETHHLFKVPSMLIIGFLSLKFNFVPISILGALLFVVRYFFEYTLEFVTTGQISYKKIPRRIMNTIGAYIFFSLFGGVLVV